MAEKTPGALMAARLLESGLGPKEARAMQLAALSETQTQKLCASYKPYPTIKIPYFGIDGKQNGFSRVRYLGEMNGFDGMRAKKLRYAQPPESDPQVYLPPMANWKVVAADPSRAVMITEGEFKAASGCAMVMPTIGLGGVWSWKSAKKNLPFLPVLEEFQWKGREVRMVFDSDFATNPDVMRALVALAKELSARGALPALVSLPDLPDLEAEGKKTGLDDFLVRKGKKALEKLFDDALPFDQSEALWRLNSEVVYIRNPGLVIVLADGRKVAPGAFKEHAYSNRHYWETKFDAKGNASMVKKPLAPAWLQWEQRAELARLTYAPGKPRVTDEGEYNYWPGWGADPKRGSVAMWHKLLDYIFKGDKAARDWFERWAAYPIQNPGEKLYSAAVLWGHRHGTGKSLIGYSLGAVYGKNFKEISDEDLGASFNEWAENKQFVMGDDVTSTEYKKATMDLLKFMITRRTLTVNAKYMPTYEVPDCINYFFTANGPDSFVLEDTDRRYFVWEAPHEPLDREFYDTYDKWLKDPDGLAPALLYHLQHVDLAGFNPRAHAMETSAKRSMILDGKGDAASWVHMLKESPDDVLRLGGMPLRGDLYSNAQLLALYDPEGKKRITANGLGREMKKAGFSQVNDGSVVRTAKGPLRLYAVRNEERWKRTKVTLLQQHWDEHFSKAAAPEKKEKF